MTKPVITNRVTKGAALTYAELDTNFSNLQNATIGVTDGTNSYAFNLNDTITFAGGTNITVGVDETTGAITITNTSAGGVNAGLANKLAFYPSAGTTVDDTRLSYSYDSGGQVITVDAGSDALKIKGTALQLSAGGIVSNPMAVVINYGGIATTATSNFQVDPGEANVIGSTGSGAQTYANNAYVDFNNFSGMIIVNRQDASSGNVAIWICGGGTAAKLGDSHGNESGIITHNASGYGYRWTNNTGATIIVNFFSIQTRGEA